MEDINYKIRFTDNTVENKNDIIIPPNTVNKSTDLLLHGRGSPHFGADNWGNMVRLLENFCSTSEPARPTEGQLWFNARSKELSVYTRKGINEYVWNKILIDGVPHGLLKFDDLEKALKDYVKKSGDVMLGSLKLVTERDETGSIKVTNDSNKLDAVSRDYVDKYIGDINESIKPIIENSKKNYIERDVDAVELSRTMGNYLILPTEFKDVNTTILKDGYDKLNNVDNFAVTKRYVDTIAKIGSSNKLPTISDSNVLLHVNSNKELEWLEDVTFLTVSGGSMLGPLYLKDPDSPKFDNTDTKLAASRAYVNYKSAEEAGKVKFTLPDGVNGQFLKLKDNVSKTLEWGTLLAGLADSNLIENGYAKIGDLQICWGNFTPDSWTYSGTKKYQTTTVNFAKSFSTQCFTVLVSPSSMLMNDDNAFLNYEVDVRVRSIDQTQFTVRVAPIGDAIPTHDTLTPKTYYIAIGK